jgi:hypothetical protein
MLVKAFDFFSALFGDTLHDFRPYFLSFFFSKPSKAPLVPCDMTFNTCVPI